MYKVIRFFWLLSLVGFLAALLLTYANLEAFVTLKFQSDGEELTIGRDLFFYVSIAIFILVNILLYVFARILRKLPEPQPEQSFWLADLKLRQRLINWLLSFVLIFNILFIIAVFIIGNMSDMYAQEEVSLSLWLYTTGVFFAIWMIALIFIFARKS